jgi:hypothetical protein
MTATYTFDVFSSLDGFGSVSGGDWAIDLKVGGGARGASRRTGRVSPPASQRRPLRDHGTAAVGGADEEHVHGPLLCVAAIGRCWGRGPAVAP